MTVNKYNHASLSLFHESPCLPAEIGFLDIALDRRLGMLQAAAMELLAGDSDNTETPKSCINKEDVSET